MTKYFRKVKFLVNFIFLLIKYKCLFLFAKIIEKEKNIILMPQNFSIGGTKKFTHYILTYFIEKKYNITVLLEKDQKEEFLNYFHYFKYELKIIESTDKYVHFQHYYPLQHSLFKYFIFNVLKQTIEILKIHIKTRSSKFFLSIARPTE